MRGTLAATGLLLVAMGCTKTWTVPPGSEEPTVIGALLGSEHRIMGDIMKYGFPDTATLRYREGYVLSYDARNKVPFWVAERLNAKRLEQKADRENLQFRVDRTLPEGTRATSNDYADSGYVRARMAAAANHTANRVAMEQTYYLSNAAPMLGEEFRIAYWVHLEKRIRAWAREGDDLYVFTGPLFLAAEGKVSYPVIGETGVGVPTHFFKVLLRERGKGKEMLAFVVPHKPVTLETPFDRFLVSVDEVERLTGLDFFRDLSEPTQSRLESTKADYLWGEAPPD